MIDHLKEVEINIDSPAGSVFRGFCKAVVIKAKKQVIIEFRRNWVNYVSLSEHAEMTVEIGNGCRRFLLKNAMARLDKEKLSILAERITSSQKKPLEPINGMQPEEQDFDNECLVCGKGVEHEEGFCRLKVGEHFIALCCPLCMEVYEKNPQRYLARLAIRNLRPPGATDGGFSHL